MKKVYETPTVEKISFRYRDQVVAASGVPGTDALDQGDAPSTGEQIIGRIAEDFGISGCANYECTSLADIWA